MTISAELSGALAYCGDIENGRIALPSLFRSWTNACALMDADLQFSESWRNLRLTEPFQIGEREQTLPAIENFAFEIGLDYRLAGTENAWQTVTIVAPERVSDAQSISTWFAQAGWALQSSSRVASFYGQPRNIILSFDPSLYEFRLWFVPQTPADRTNQQEVSGLPETYRPVRELLTAHERLVDCGYDDATYDRYMKVIETKLEIWMPRWERFKNKPLKREGSRRPGYKRAGRASRTRARM